MKRVILVVEIDIPEVGSHDNIEQPLDAIERLLLSRFQRREQDPKKIKRFPIVYIQKQMVTHSSYENPPAVVQILGAIRRKSNETRKDLISTLLHSI